MGNGRGCSLTFVLALLAIAAWVVHAATWRDFPNERERVELQAQIAPIVSRLEAHRSEHGAYPTDLAGLGWELPRSDFGPWTYAVSDERDACWLSVGDYGDDGYMYFWGSSDGEWHIDL